MAVVVVAGACLVWLYVRLQGTPEEYAARWREALAPLSDPDAARSQYQEVAGKRFANGEWVFGVCRDSHGFSGGGALVVKDSTGRVRTFFGHVCGSGRLEYMLREVNSLEEFYKAPDWRQFDLREQGPP